MTAALIAGLVAGYGVALPIGAIGAYLVSLTARTSLRIGASAALGVATADGIYALLATVGGSMSARAIEPISNPLRWASVVILATMAARLGATAVRRFRTAPAPTSPIDMPAEAPDRAYFRLLALTLVNPLTLVYFSALVLGRQGSSSFTAGSQCVFVLAAFAASASWQLLLAGGGALLGRILAGPRGRLITALVSCALIATLAARLALFGG